ncbi:MAG: class I SAM-dependent methyltransferase [Sandaracinaceae bacterium]|nr:class I SAM-dependent methyltransferase [Sandaracinaceae bacterium]
MYHEKGPTLRELAQQALSSTDRGYDLLAPKFDYTPFRTPDVLLERAAELVRERGGATARGLDLCCGTGAGLRAFRPLCTEAIVGIDRSEGMLAVARERLADAPGTARVELVRGDALETPFESGSFGLVTCFGAFGHILVEDEPRFVREVTRLLAPGGRFVFITGERPPAWAPELWVAKGFNAVMRVRNALLKPEFIMYYLTFLLPGARWLCEANGLEVEVISGAFPKPFARAKLVIAQKPATRRPL